MAAEAPNHPSFPRPENPRAMLWRYMDLHKFVWMVRERRLFMPRLSLLETNDPMEGTTPPAELAWWQPAAANATTDEQRQRLLHNRQAMDGFVKMYRPHWYVSCWHMQEFENYAMWRCFTSTPSAVAIHTTFEDLEECLPEYVQVGIVRYIDYRKDQLASLNLFEHIMHKRHHFSYEREVRAVISGLSLPELGGDHIAFHSTATAYTPPIDLHRLIRGIRLHPEASLDVLRSVEKLVADANLPKPDISEMVMQAVK
ncbi:MAG: hypothetical protein K2P94_15465 [Rhodospirillaceae bacterium]|nr:hypothetical protein [Rhodospirillaceae bacterium]